MLPTDWECKKNKELFDNKNIKNFPNEPVLSVTQDKGVIPRDFLDKRITMESSNTANFKLVEYGDFIISLRSFQGGLEVSKYRGIVSPAYTVIKPKLPIETDFFKYFFKSNKFINILNKAVIGIRDGKQISFSVFSELYTPYPPLSEQRKIAAILSTVDEAIEKTEAIIEQTEKVKKGLMQQLLTKGIGHTKFKKTEIGEIPEEWEVKKVGEIANVIRGASPRPKGDPRYYGGTVPRLMVEDVTRDKKYVTPKVDFLTEEGAKLSRPMKKGDLVVVCSGTVGVPAILAVDACIHDGFLGLKDIDKNCDKEYLFYTFSLFRNKLDASATHGGVFTNLTTQIMREFSFPLPPIDEQKKIVEILTSVDEKIYKEKETLNSLQSIKKGLMQSLLTGKVRVKVDEDEVVSS